MIDFRSVREHARIGVRLHPGPDRFPEEIRGPKDPKERERLEMPGLRTWWSWGEVTKPETINYRSFKPEKDGLFCERIFGPVKDWECHCGKYKRIRYRGVICDRCGVEVTLSQGAPRAHGAHRARRARRAHLVLQDAAQPDGQPRSTSRCVISRRSSTTRTTSSSSRASRKSQVNQLLDEDEYLDAAHEGEGGGRHRVPRRHRRARGARAARAPRRRQGRRRAARRPSSTETSQHRKKMLLKRLKIVDAFRNSGDSGDVRNKPEWMILDVIPVIPPDLRPLVPLDGGRFATSDLNDLYRRVINRNNRLQKLIIAPRAGSHSPQREAHAAGGGRRAVRQRPPLQGDSRPRQASAQVAVRHAQGQAGPVPSEPARQARGLLGPFGHRRRSRAQAAPVRSAEADGARAVQAVHHPQARREGHRRDGEARQEDRGARDRPRCTRSSKRSFAITRCCSTARRRFTAWASRRSSRCSSKARPSVFTRSSARRSTPTSTVTRWPCTCRCRSRRSSSARLLMLSSNNILKPSDGRPVAEPQPGHRARLLLRDQGAGRTSTTRSTARR